MFATTEDLAELLAVAVTGPERFRGRCLPNPRGIVFGGHVAAQALHAAGRTLPAAGPVVHSLHAYFLRAGDADLPVDYTVERVRDGRSYLLRTVVARQGAATLLTLTASFAPVEPGLDHQDPAPAVCPPREAAAYLEHPIEARAAVWAPPGAVDSATGRGVLDPASVVGEPITQQSIWMRSAAALPDDPLLHACALTFVSDMTLGWAPWKAHGVHGVTPGMFAANLDHAMWFHGPVRADRWMLFAQRSPRTAGGRSLSEARVYDEAGCLVASVAQEGVMRRRQD